MTVAISKDQPGGASGGYYWEKAGDVVDIDDPDLAAQLLHTPGFSLADTKPARPAPAAGRAKRTPITETD